MSEVPDHKMCPTCSGLGTIPASLSLFPEPVHVSYEEYRASIPDEDDV